jgi:hypothetical protein
MTKEVREKKLDWLREIIREVVREELSRIQTQAHQEAQVHV